MITIYNTLTRQKEQFKPIEQNKIRMYVCGPTVYDVPHIGHARSAYVFDVVRRYFEHRGYEVFFVKNVTDVDDKIIKKAAEELKKNGEQISSRRLKEKASEVAVRYLDLYHQEMDMLGIRPPTVEPKATENIPGMIDFISILIEKGYAYPSGGNVYFSVEKFKEYGKLSHQNKDEMLHGARVEPGKDKKYPLDFALWKTAREEEPSWKSPWGPGRPGWHIECSAMSTSLLGDEFDIHGGGLDLIFPHHENEIAQAEAATGRKFANYWMHNGLLTVDSEKMSKSLGNFITIADFLDKHRDPDLLKMSFLNSHYRSPMDYTEDKIEEAARSKERIMIFLDKAERVASEVSGTSRESYDDRILADARKTMEELEEKFDEAMDDDFNTPAAMSAVFEAVKRGNDHLADDNIDPEGKAYISAAIKNCILKFAGIFGLSLNPVKIGAGEARKVEKLVAEREEARAKKDYASSDRLRDELLRMGVVVEDTPEGPVWRKK